MKLPLSIFFLLLFTTLIVRGQLPFFETYELPDPHKRVIIRKVHQGKEGYIWFGTDVGLFQFDGTNYQLHLRPDSIKTNKVTSLYNGLDGQLWIGYQDGGVAYLDKNQLQVWSIPDSLNHHPITGFLEDKQGDFWIGTYGSGLLQSSKKGIRPITKENGLSSNDVYTLCMGKDGRIWAGTDRGINICTLKGEQLNIDKIGKAQGLPDEIVTDLLVDKQGDFWIATQDKGIFFYRHQEKTIEVLSPEWDKGAIHSLELFENTELWMTTQRNGVFRYLLSEKGFKKMEGLKQTLAKARVFDLLKDREGNIWVTANASKIYKAHRQFEFLPSPFHNIQTILSDINDKLWVGTAKGLYSLETNADGSTYFKPHLEGVVTNVLSLYQDTYDNIWIGTFGDGVYCYHETTGMIKRLGEQEGLKNGSIFSIDGNDQYICLATLSGITTYSAKYSIFDNDHIQFENLSKKDGLSTNYIYKVFIDSQNRTWFGTDGDGISKLEKGKIQNFPNAILPNKDTLPLKAVYSITEDKLGNIWFSTDNQGIFQFDGTDFHRLSLKEGIRNLTITSLMSNQQGDILLVHPNGIDLLDPETKHLIYYGKEVGIASLDPHLNAACLDAQSNVWIADQKGLIRFTALQENLEIHPKTILKEVSLDLQPIDFQQRHTFDYDQNNFAFNYAGLWYTHPDVVKYRYQLIGHDPNWIYSKDQQATYSGLPPGKYTFKVTSTENDVFDHEPFVQYAFEIQTPIWQRAWFIGVSIIAFMGLLYGFIKLRDQRIQRISLLEKEKIESQFQALKSQINPHFLFNTFNTLATVIDENPEQAIEFVEKLSDFYRTMMLYRDKEVIPLIEEINLVKDYTYLLKKRFGENLKINIALKENGLFVAPLSIQILVENAIKHNIISRAYPLQIDIGKEEEGYIFVKNSIQPKLTNEDSTGFGLQSLHKQYALLSRKKVLVENDGTFYKVSLPCILKKTTQND